MTDKKSFIQLKNQNISTLNWDKQCKLQQVIHTCLKETDMHVPANIDTRS